MIRPAIIRMPRMVCFLAASLALAAITGCSAMLMGDGGSAGRPIGSSSATARPSSSDRRIAETIRGRYSADTEISASRIEVSCLAGVVTLRGQVSDYAIRDRAIRLARDVNGVSRVSVQIGISR